jgi:hypothetical protein
VTLSNNVLLEKGFQKLKTSIQTSEILGSTTRNGGIVVTNNVKVYPKIQGI